MTTLVTARPVYSPEEFIELDIGSMRTRFPAETVGYDDITLFNVCMEPEDDLSDSDWAELLLKHQPTPELSEESGDGIATLAQKFAARVSKATEAAMDKAADGKEDWQGGPITVRAGLLADFGKELNGWPLPGSKSGNNPDKFKAPHTNKATGDTSLRPTSFYLMFTRGTPKGQAIETELAYLRRAGNMEAIKTDIPAAIMGLSDKARKDRIAYLDNRIKVMTSAYKKAMSLHLQTVAFDELATRVDAEGKVNEDASKNTRFKQGTVRWAFKMVQDNNGEDTDVINTKLQAPITVWASPGYDVHGEPRPIAKQKDVSIGAFIKFKAAVALAKGCTYDALLKTVERAPKSKDKSKTADTKTATVDQFISRFVEEHRFAFEMESATDPKDLTKLYDVLKADARSKDGGELVAAWIEHRNWMDDVAKELQLNAAYVDIAARLAKVAKAA